MAKRAYLDQGIEEIIGKVYFRDKKAAGKDILKAVNEHPDMLKLGRQVSLSTIQAKVARWRREEEEKRRAGIPVDELDQPWSMGALNLHPIDPEAVPVLVKMQVDAKRLGKPISIREARWIAYLLRFTKLKKTAAVKEIKGFMGDDYIRGVSLTYSLRERIAELTKTQVDTSDLDDAMSTENQFVFYTKFLEAFVLLKKSEDPKYMDKIKQKIQEVYESLGIPIDTLSFTKHGSYVQYLIWIGTLDCYKKWDTLSKDEQKDLLFNLQNAIKQSETTLDFQLPNRYLQLLEGVK